MKKEDFILRELCREVALKGIDSDRFTELWMQSGIELDSPEFDIANLILRKHEEEAYLQKRFSKMLH